MIILVPGPGMYEAWGRMARDLLGRITQQAQDYGSDFDPVEKVRKSYRLLMWAIGAAFLLTAVEGLFAFFWIAGLKSTGVPAAWLACSFFCFGVIALGVIAGMGWASIYWHCRALRIKRHARTAWLVTYTICFLLGLGLVPLIVFALQMGSRRREILVRAVDS